MILLPEDEWDSLYELIDEALIRAGVNLPIRNNFFEIFNNLLQTYQDSE